MSYDQTAADLLTENRELRAEVERLRGEWDRLNDMRVDANNRAFTAETKLHKIAMLKVWRNEDGKSFVFVDDLFTALNGGDV